MGEIDMNPLWSGYDDVLEKIAQLRSKVDINKSKLIQSVALFIKLNEIEFEVFNTMKRLQAKVLLFDENNLKAFENFLIGKLEYYNSEVWN